MKIENLSNLKSKFFEELISICKLSWALLEVGHEILSKKKVSQISNMYAYVTNTCTAINSRITS